MNYGFWAIVSLALAVILIVAEIFLPSGGIISIVMVLSFFSAIYCAYQAWWETAPVFFWAFSGFAGVAIPSSLLLAFYWLEKSPWGKRVILYAPPEKEVTPFSAEEERLRKYLGMKTLTLTPLAPGGLISIQGERIHCITEGKMLDAQVLVKVVGVSGTRLKVEEAAHEELSLPENLVDDLQAPKPNTEPDSKETNGATTASQPIDFEFN